MAYGMKESKVTERAKKGAGLIDNSKLVEEGDNAPIVFENEEPVTINPLRNETVVVRFIERYRGITGDREGDFFGGMGTRSEWPLYVPTKHSSSELMNPLTKSEKEYFESVLGRDLGIYPKNGQPSYWMSGAEGAWNCVLLRKSGLILHLDNIRDYFYYKILLLHRELIASSLEELENNPRATQLFYMSSEVEEVKNKSAKANMKYEAFLKYGEIKDNRNALSYLIFMMDNRQEARSSTMDQLQMKVTNYIDNDLKRIKDLLDDPLMETKAMLVAAARLNRVVLYDTRTGFFYLKEDNKKMCEDHEEPRLSAAARWVNKASQSDIFNQLLKAVSTAK